MVLNEIWWAGVLVWQLYLYENDHNVTFQFLMMNLIKSFHISNEKKAAVFRRFIVDVQHTQNT